MVLAATNRPSELDEAILRRLPQAFEIGMPDLRERVEILKVILKDERVEEDIDFDHISGLCDGYTGSDLLELCKKAAYFPIRDLLNDEKNGKSSPVSIDFIVTFHESSFRFFYFPFGIILLLNGFPILGPVQLADLSWIINLRRPHIRGLVETCVVRIPTYWI